MLNIPSQFAQYLLVGSLILTLIFIPILIFSPSGFAYFTINIYSLYNKFFYTSINGKESVLLVSIITLSIVSFLVSMGLLTSLLSAVLWSVRDAFIFNDELSKDKRFSRGMEFLKSQAPQFNSTVSEMRKVIQHWDLFLSLLDVFRCKVTFSQWRISRKEHRQWLKNNDLKPLRHLRVCYDSAFYFLTSYVYCAKDVDISLLSGQIWLSELWKSVSIAFFVSSAFLFMDTILSFAIPGGEAVWYNLLILFGIIFVYFIFLWVTTKPHAIMHRRVCRILLSMVYVLAHRDEPESLQLSTS